MPEAFFFLNRIAVVLLPTLTIHFISWTQTHQNWTASVFSSFLSNLQLALSGSVDSVPMTTSDSCSWLTGGAESDVMICCCRISSTSRFLRDRTFSLKTDDVSSSGAHFKCGVPQRSILGPILFGITYPFIVLWMIPKFIGLSQGPKEVDGTKFS